jgi:cytochrome c biogenesis protein CcmG/thiol:disulfide interchange protein DsbE
VAEDDEQTVDADAPRDDAPDDEAPEGDAPDRPARRRGLDGRTLAICALVAVIAALLAGFATSRLTDDDGDPDGRGILTEAEELPDIALPRFDGSELRTGDFRGQPLVINFWASWCVPCVDEMPAFQEVHESLGDSVAFLGVNSRDTVDSAEQMIETTGVTYELARDVDGALARALDVASLPVTVLVLPDGTIVETLQREVSSARLCEAINQTLLNQSLGEGDCG